MEEETKITGPATEPADEQTQTAGQPQADGQSQTPQPATSVNPTDSEIADSLDRLLAEAEQRGYLRARNEIAQAAMKKPRLWENERLTAAEKDGRNGAPSQPAVPTATDKEEGETFLSDPLAADFLARIRPSVWD